VLEIKENFKIKKKDNKKVNAEIEFLYSKNITLAKKITNPIKQIFMPFTGNEDHEINLATASDWTRRFRNSLPENPPDPTISHFFGKEYLLSMLAQTDCVGLRIYYALDENDNKQLVISGVNADEDDLYEGILAENSLKGPPFSGTANSLNS